MQPELFSRWTLPISQPSWRRRQRRRKRASSSFTKLVTTLTARSPTRSGSARERTILEQTAGGLETMELLGTNQKTGKYTNTLLLLATQILLAAVGWAQAISLPEPPQVRAKNHVDRKSTRLNSSHLVISYAVFCLKKKKKKTK